MNSFSAFPFYRLLLFLLLGLLFRFYCSTVVTPVIVIFIILVALSIACIYAFNKKSFKSRWIPGFCIAAIIFSCGFFLKPFYHINSDVFQKSYFYNGEILRILKADKNKQKLIIDCRDTSTDYNLHFAVIGYNDIKESGRSFCPGDHIFFHSCIQKIKTDNPYVFNYGDYLLKRDVFGFVNLQKSNFIFINHSFRFQSVFSKFRVIAKKKLGKLNLSDVDYGILTALTLGDKSFVDHELRTEFSDAGVIHLLAVSGLHVGIIYLLMSYLFKGLDRKGLKGIRLFIILSGLWFYAFLTGLSPSVLRATIMFSLFLVSGNLNYSYQIYHSMTISAFIIIVIDPYSILNAGFWLSFLAVASIIYFYPIIYGLFVFSKPWNKYLWSLISVSFAVEIGTAPLTIYLFGYFPLWFLLSNILVVPVVSFILGSALICLIVPGQTFLFKIFESVISAGLHYCELCVHWIGHFPYAHLTKIQIGSVELVFFYISLLAFISWRSFKKYKLVCVTMIFLAMFLAFNFMHSFQNNNSISLIVYNCKKHSFVSIVKGGEVANVYIDDLTMKDSDYFLPPLLSHFEVQRTKIHDISQHKIVCFISDFENALLLNANLNEKDVLTVLQKVKLVIFTKAVSNDNVISIIKRNKNKQFVFDRSYSKFRCEQIKKRLKLCCSNVHYVSIDGAFVYEDNTGLLSNWFQILF